MRGQEAYPHHAPRYPPVTARRWGSRPTSRRPLPGKGNQKLRPDRKNTLRSAPRTAISESAALGKTKNKYCANSQSQDWR